MPQEAGRPGSPSQSTRQCREPAPDRVSDQTTYPQLCWWAIAKLQVSAATHSCPRPMYVPFEHEDHASAARFGHISRLRAVIDQEQGAAPASKVLPRTSTPTADMRCHMAASLPQDSLRALHYSSGTISFAEDFQISVQPRVIRSDQVSPPIGCT